MNTNVCEYCLNYEYDEFTGMSYCQVSLDEDEMARYMSNTYYNCPYFQSNNEYEVVKKQN